MSAKATTRKRNAKRPALFRDPAFDENPSPAKLAVWHGRLQEETFDSADATVVPAVFAPLSYEKLENRARRLTRKIESWDRRKLETYYVRTLLSAQLLRRSQRMLDVALHTLNALAQQNVGHEELRKTARLLAMYANMLLKPELARHRGYSKGGVKGSAERKRDAARRHDRWHTAYCQYIEAGGNTRNAASTLAPRFKVTARTFREGIKEAQARATATDSSETN